MFQITIARHFEILALEFEYTAPFFSLYGNTIPKSCDGSDMPFAETAVELIFSSCNQVDNHGVAQVLPGGV